METNHLKTLHLLEMIAEKKATSQRYFSKSLNISLGLVNAFIKRLVKKGFCKVTSLPSNRVKYMLTPAGVKEKTRLTYEYISSSYQYFKMAKNRLQIFFAALEIEGIRRVVFYGAAELGDIALLSMTGTKLKLIDVVDPSMVGARFSNTVVKATTRLKRIDFDVVVITAAEDHETAIETIKTAGVPMDRIRFFN